MKAAAVKHRACGAVDAGEQQVIVQTHRPNEAAANELFSLPTVSWKQSLPVISTETAAWVIEAPTMKSAITVLIFFQSAQTERSDVATATSRVGLDGPV